MAHTGGAWLSSARVVRCWVKSRNERNPRVQLPAEDGGTLGQTAGDKPEEGGDDVKSSCPLSAWATHVLQWRIQRAAEPARGSEPQKVPSQFGSESATRLREAGIASNRGSACRGEYVSALYTPPVKPWESAMPEAGWPKRKGIGGAVEGRADDWG